MKKKIIIGLVILILAAMIIGINISNKDSKNNESNLNNDKEITGNVIDTENSENSSPGINRNAVGGGSESGVAGESSSGITEENISDIQKILPADLYTQKCGTYYSEYGACAGACPEGICVTEGRSCYCKIV